MVKVADTFRGVTSKIIFFEDREANIPEIHFPLVLGMKEISETLGLQTSFSSEYTKPPSQVVRLGGYIANLCDFYSYRPIGKLTDFLQLQEFSLRILPVDSSTSAARQYPRSLKRVWATS